MSHKGFRAKPRRGPTIEKRTVTPRRPKNTDVRPREFLTAEEVERLIAAAKKDTRRHTHRDATMILLAYRHGLRASELIGVRWDMLDLEQGTFHVSRRKNGRAAMHLLRGSEIRALRRLKREQRPSSPYVFTSERAGPMSVAGFQKLVRRVGEQAGFPFPVHPHMLRHGCGFKLAHDGHDTRAIQEWLGHRNIQHTTRYTELTHHQALQRLLAAGGLTEAVHFNCYVSDLHSRISVEGQLQATAFRKCSFSRFTYYS